MSECCFPGTAAPAQALFPVQHQTSPYEAAGAHYDSILELILSEVISSFPPLDAKQTDRTALRKSSLNFQLVFHTHSLPPPPAILVATITRNKFINKQLLFQTRHNFYYNFNFLQRICIGKFPAQNSRVVTRAGIFLETKSGNVCGTALGILLECAVAQQEILL